MSTETPPQAPPQAPNRLDELSRLRKVMKTPLGASAGVKLAPGALELADAVIHLRRMLTDWTKKRRYDVARELEASLVWVGRAAEIDGEKWPDYQALVLRVGREYAEDANTVRRIPERERPIAVVPTRR